LHQQYAHSPLFLPCLLACSLSSDVGALLEGKPHFRKLEFTADMLSDPEDLVQLRRRFPRVGGERASALRGGSTASCVLVF
jgi:hypothetical protein